MWSEHSSFSYTSNTAKVKRGPHLKVSLCFLPGVPGIDKLFALAVVTLDLQH